jgi:hypothetical protein
VLRRPVDDGSGPGGHRRRSRCGWAPGAVRCWDSRRCRRRARQPAGCSLLLVMQFGTGASSGLHEGLGLLGFLASLALLVVLICCGRAGRAPSFCRAACCRASVGWLRVGCGRCAFGTTFAGGAQDLPWPAVAPCACRGAARDPVLGSAAARVRGPGGSRCAARRPRSTAEPRTTSSTTKMWRRDM